jgi:uncharacterized damage-inducible protein DinB
VLEVAARSFPRDKASPYKHAAPMVWTAPEISREEPRGILGEREMLERWLDYHRATLEAKCAGLTAEQLRLRSVEPSSMSLLGLVRHMAEVERSWFQRRAAGRDIDFIYCDVDTNPDGDFDDVDTADAAADLATYGREIAEARAAVAGRSLDDTFVHQRLQVEMSVRWVFIHMIEEYARHNGHADLLRERIDGATGE